MFYIYILPAYSINRYLQTKRASLQTCMCLLVTMNTLEIKNCVYMYIFNFKFMQVELICSLLTDWWWALLVLWIPCSQITNKNCKYFLLVRFLIFHGKMWYMWWLLLLCKLWLYRPKIQVFIGIILLQQLKEMVYHLILTTFILNLHT